VPPLSRRSALGAISGLAATIGGGLAALVAGFVSNAFGKTRSNAWLLVGKAEDLSADTFGRIVVTVPHRHAWIDASTSLTIFVKDLYPKDPIAFSATCSHLGCTVGWHADRTRFVCPCHGGEYDTSGEVVAGPPPRALTRLETKVENEMFYVRVPATSQRA